MSAMNCLIAAGRLFGVCKKKVCCLLPRGPHFLIAFMQQRTLDEKQVPNGTLQGPFHKTTL